MRAGADDDLDEVISVVREALKHRDTLVTGPDHGNVAVWHRLVPLLTNVTKQPSGHVAVGCNGELAARCAIELADLDRSNGSELAQVVFCKLAREGHWDAAGRVFALINEQDCIPEEYAIMQAVLRDQSLMLPTPVDPNWSAGHAKLEGHQTIGDVLESIGHDDMSKYHRMVLGRFVKSLIPTVRIRPKRTVREGTRWYKAIAYFPFEVEKVRKLTLLWITEHYEDYQPPRQSSGVGYGDPDHRSNPRKRKWYRGRPGDWPCPNEECQYMVFGKHSECQLCGTPKPLEGCIKPAPSTSSTPTPLSPGLKPLSSQSGGTGFVENPDSVRELDYAPMLSLTADVEPTDNCTIEWSAVADASEAEVVAALARRLVKAGDISGAEAKVVGLVTAHAGAEQYSSDRNDGGNQASDRAVVALVEALLMSGHRAHAIELLVSDPRALWSCSHLSRLGCVCTISGL